MQLCEQVCNVFGYQELDWCDQARAEASVIRNGSNVMVTVIT